MRRREFVAGTGILLAGVAVPTFGLREDEHALKQAVIENYHAFFVERDKQKYLAMLTDDYMLLENGELLDREGDLALMPAADINYQRTDEFDFRSVKVHGDIAYLIYFLRSKISDTQKGKREREFLESAIMRRTSDGWKMALLHSTLIAKPEAS